MSLSMLENVGIILRDRRLPVAAPTTRAGEPSRSPRRKSKLIFVDHTVLHDELKILLRIGHDFHVAQGISFDDQKVGIGSGRNGSQIAALHEQLAVDAGGGANDIGRIVELYSPFNFPDLRLFRLRTPASEPAPHI